MKKVKVVLRDPLNKQQMLDYTIAVNDTPLAENWYAALQDLLRNNNYLEKNFCFLGFPNSQRDIPYICAELNKAADQINQFFGKEYWIDEVYTPWFIQQVDKQPNQLAMNLLHNHFEHLQGTVGGLSEYYKRADYETKFAIRQLNNLCHEAESLMLSQRKQITAPEWVRPSQITTFLNAPRYDLQDKDYKLFLENRYNREFGGVYLHWAQIGKTHLEVFRDEDGKDIDQATCSAINALKYYSGEFDVEWGRDIDEQHPWHAKEQAEFKSWLGRNNLDYNDPKMSLGYIKLGKVNLQRSFGTEDFFKIIDILSKHLDIYKIRIDDVESTYDYVWSDDNYKQMQIDFLRPGYDWSRATI